MKIKEIANTIPREQQVKRLLLRKQLTITELANTLDCSPASIERCIKKLADSGHTVKTAGEHTEIVRSVEPEKRLVLQSKQFFDGKKYRFGVLGDTHLYSKYARLDVLNALYDIYEREGITTVFHTGNIVDGECSYNRYDLVGPSGIDNQLDYLVNEYPVRKNITTKFITGDDHEGWWINREGINIGERIVNKAEDAGRTDLEFIGHMERDIVLKARNGESWMRIVHPGGGSSYAISYSGQKLVESYSGGEKPHILILGHYHKYDSSYYREVWAVQTGCCQDQTPFMRKNKLQAHVGGCIMSYHQATTGEINRFTVEFIPFYNKGFYETKGRYKRY